LTSKQFNEFIHADICLPDDGPQSTPYQAYQGLALQVGKKGHPYATEYGYPFVVYEQNPL